MAYVAVISLAQTLEQLMQRKPCWISDETRTMVESVLDSLEYFQEFLKNASKRRLECGKVEELEKAIKTAVSEAEDVIELKISKIYNATSMGREALSKTFLRTWVEKNYTRKRDVMGRMALRKTLLSFVKKIDAVKMNVMRSSFGTNEVQCYGDATKEDLQMGASFPGHSSGYVAELNSENIVVGLEDDLMTIITRLKGPMSTREIIPILGMGGIGKTTFAKMAYDDPEIRHRFDIHVWVTVSQEYRIKDLLLGVLSFTPNEIKEDTDDQLMDMIYKKLKGRRYLVVMDDIWSSDVWDLMIRTFPDDNNGSRIILTSRVKGVATHADPDSTPHEMSLLNLEESWKLLHNKVFGIHQVCPLELEVIGKQVAQRCHGLPLTLLVVAGHLSKIARTIGRWEDVAESISNVVANESDICLGVLAMSYNYLPNHLKPCFLYMGIFPEDSEVNVRTLITLWVSEGFLLEEAGRDCLEDLVSRNLIMVRKRRYNGGLKTCVVHDLVRDLVLRVAEKEKFLQVTRINEATNPSAKKLRVRRYSCHSCINYDTDCWESLSSITRTVYFFDSRIYKANCWESLSSLIRPVHIFRGLNRVYLLERLKLLRVLVILDYEFHHFPLEITKLVHLRYLQFNCHDDIHRSVSQLYNLQTFIFRQLVGGSKPSTLPAAIWGMKPLRHLQLSHFFSFPSVPSNYKQLRNLVVLSSLPFTSCTSELFSAIPNLRRLKIRHEDWMGGIAISYLNKLSCLKELEILKIKCSASRGRSSSFPSKFDLPTSLQRLTLEGTCLPWEDMANIVKLPNLQELKIKQFGFGGCVWRLNDEEIFNQLKFLLIGRTNLKRWDAGSVNFPKLQHLVLRYCTYLEEIPMDFGEICTLESLEVYECGRSATRSAEEIQEEQENMGNSFLNDLITDNLRD